MYDINSLVAVNGSYHMQHKVTQSDVDMVNTYIKIIEASRTDHSIQAGDIVEFTCRHGSYYRNGHFERRSMSKENHWNICEQPHIPFINLTTAKNNIICSTSGGAWRDIPSTLKLLGKRNKLFKDWGHCRPCANGAVAFEAEVNVWEFYEPDPLYGEYSTKYYDKHFIHYCADEQGRPLNGSTYIYFGNCFAFTSKADYEAWRDTFKGVEFAGNGPNQTVVFTYKRIEKLIPKAEYDSLGLPTDTRICNGTIKVRVKYDDSAHTITEYRYTNDGSERRGEKPYSLIRQ